MDVGQLSEFTKFSILLTLYSILFTYLRIWKQSGLSKNCVGQASNAFKVPIRCDKFYSVLHSLSCNPDVVTWYRSALTFEMKGNS